MNNVYLIYGSDYGLIKREIDKLTNGISDIVKYDLSISKIDEVLDDACLISIFGDKKVVIGENALFLTTESNDVNHNIDYLINYINDNNQNIVILTVSTEKLDERKKIVKLFKEKVNVIYKKQIDQKKLDEFVIEEFKINGYEIDSKTAKYFVDYIGKNVDILISEIKKMIDYKEENKKINIEDIDNISSKGFKDNFFDLADGIMKKDFKKIYECYNDLITIGMDPVKIVSSLGSHFLYIYQVKLLSSEGKNSMQIENILKMHSYRVKLALESDFMLSELEDYLKRLHELDVNIKKNSENKFIGLENFLLHL